MCWMTTRVREKSAVWCDDVMTHTLVGVGRSGEILAGSRSYRAASPVCRQLFRDFLFLRDRGLTLLRQRSQVELNWF